MRNPLIYCVSYLPLWRGYRKSNYLRIALTGLLVLKVHMSECNDDFIRPRSFGNATSENMANVTSDCKCCKCEKSQKGQQLLIISTSSIETHVPCPAFDDILFNFKKDITSWCTSLFYILKFN